MKLDCPSEISFFYWFWTFNGVHLFLNIYDLKLGCATSVSFRVMNHENQVEKWVLQSFGGFNQFSMTCVFGGIKLVLISPK